MRFGCFRARRFATAGLCLLLPIAMLAGCKDEDSGKPKIRQREGIAKRIDTENRIVAMSIANKDGQTIDVEGTFREDTAVIINGRTASISDIRLGDKVEVHGYKEGEGLAMKWIAVKVIVNRPEEQDWKTAGNKTGESSATGSSKTPAPTTQPARD